MLATAEALEHNLSPARPERSEAESRDVAGRFLFLKVIIKNIITSN